MTEPTTVDIDPKNKPEWWDEGAAKALARGKNWHVVSLVHAGTDKILGSLPKDVPFTTGDYLHYNGASTEKDDEMVDHGRFKVVKIERDVSWFTFGAQEGEDPGTIHTMYMTMTKVLVMPE